MEQMTPRERIAAALEGREVDHVPFCPFLAYVWEHFPQEIQDAGGAAFHEQTGADMLHRGCGAPIRTIGPAGVESEAVEQDGRTVVITKTPVGTLRQASVRSDVGNTNFLVEHPLKTEEDFKVQMWIEENTRFEYVPDGVTEHLANEGERSFSIGMLIPRCKTAFQSMIETCVGTEELNYALVDFPETVEALWRTMVERDLEAARLTAQCDFEYFLTWEDSSTQNYSPAQYDKYIASEIGQWCSILAANGKRYVQHACGHLGGILASMKASGVYGVESIPPPPTGNISIKDARAKVGGDFAIIGGIEPTMFLNLSMDELAGYTENTIEEARGGPFVLANSDSCPPGVTKEKFKLVADIAKSHS